MANRQITEVLPEILTNLGYKKNTDLSVSARDGAKVTLASSSGGSVDLPIATATQAGLMSAADKLALSQGGGTGGTGGTVGVSISQVISGLVNQVGVYSNPLAVKFDRLYTHYPSVTVSGPIAFSADSVGAFPSATAVIELVSDGINVPTFTGIKTLDGLTYDNRVGAKNFLQFICLGNPASPTFWVTYLQELNAVLVTSADTTAPTITSAVIQSAANTVVRLTYSEALSIPSIPAASAFTVTGKTVASVSITGSVVSLTCSTAFVSTDVVTVSYTPPTTGKIQDTSGNNAIALSGYSVTNNIGGVASNVLSFPTRAGATINEVGNSYTIPVFSGTSWQTFMLASKSLPANTDGWIMTESVANGTMLGFNASNTNEFYSGYEFFAWANGTGTYFRGTNGGGTTATSVTAINSWHRLKRTSGVISHEVSNDKLSWTTTYTWPTANNGILYANIAFGSAVTINPTHEGFV
jgi:hypothetical protein